MSTDHYQRMYIITDTMPFRDRKKWLQPMSAPIAKARSVGWYFVNAQRFVKL